MNNANRSFPTLSTIILASVMLLALSVSIWGREARPSQAPITVGGVQITGVPDDWSHHHLVFSDPGIEEDAVRNHTHEMWLKVVNDPRYIFQQLKHSLPAQGPAAYDVGTTEEARSWEATRMEEAARTNEVGEVANKKKNKATITRDWSMNLGSAAGASLTAVIGATVNATTLPSGSSFTIDGQTFTASAPVAEIATAQFTGEPANPSSIALGGVTYNFSTATTISAPGSGCTIKSSSSTSTDATLLYDAIANNGSQTNTTWECASGSTPNSVLSAASPSSSTVTLTAKTAGSTGFTESTTGTIRITYTVTTTGSNGTTSSTGFAYWTGSTYVSQSTLASNIATALGMNSTINSTYTIGAANSPIAGDIVITNQTVGTSGNGQTLTSSFTALTGGTFAGGQQSGSAGAGTYPAKYSFSTTTANCGNATTPDYAVYNTGVAGSSTQPSIIAYDNLYSGCTAPYPQIYWQYNTNGGTVGTSPVLSGDGTQVAFMQTTGTAASLVILRWSKSATLTTLSNTAASSYHGCTAPCMTVLSLSGGADDSNSSPYYDYGSDTLYVGDDAGKLHKFVNVFNGTPAESASNGWPVTVSTQSAPMLTGAVYNANSALVYLGDAGGYLYSVTTTGSSSQLVVQSYQLAVSPGIIDGPLVDPVAGEVYVFVGEDMNGSNSNSPCVPGSTGACNGVYQLPAGFTATTKWKESVMGVGTTNPVYIGSFDNIYYSSSNSASPTGNLYVCGYIGGSTNEPKLVNATISANAFTGSMTGNPTVTDGTMVNATNVDKPMTSAAAACSPVTEFYNSTSPATDWIFLGVSANGSLTASGSNKCSGSGSAGACVYSFNVNTALTGTTAPVDGLAAAGGTGGIVIDNSVGSGTLAGASQIYFSTISSQACAGNSASAGAGTGGCAVQASQSALQ